MCWWWCGCHQRLTHATLSSLYTSCVGGACLVWFGTSLWWETHTATFRVCLSVRQCEPYAPVFYKLNHSRVGLRLKNCLPRGKARRVMIAIQFFTNSRGFPPAQTLVGQTQPKNYPHTQPVSLHLQDNEDDSDNTMTPP